MRIILAIVLTLTATCFAQAPVETGRLSGEQLQRDQFKAGSAYSEMQRAEEAAKQADAMNKEAQKRAAEAQQQAEAAKKKFEAAKAREVQARKAYEDALNAVDRVANPPKN